MQPEKYFIIHKTVAKFIGLLLFIVCLILLVAWLSSHKKPASCEEFARQGKVNIQYGDSDYNPALDRYKNRVACQA